MPSPTRPLRTSPERKALHERSDSSTNERSVRMVGDPQAPSYTTPFPTKPSQILSPKGYQRSGAGAEFGVSNRPTPLDETKSSIGPQAPTPSSPVRKEPRSTDNVSPTPPSSTNASSHTPQSPPPAVGASGGFLPVEQPLEEEGRLSDDIVQLPSVPARAGPSGISIIDRSGTSPRQPIVEKDSDTSLSSSNSTGTVIVKKNKDGKKRASYSAFPNVIRPSSSRSNLSALTPSKPAGKDTGGPSTPDSPLSLRSPVSPAASTPTESQNSPSPVQVGVRQPGQSSSNIQYPIIRPPSASASFVDPSDSFVQRPQRVFERNPDRWNPHLSTVPSEGTGSQSEGRSSQSTRHPDSNRVSKSSSMALGGRMSSDQPPIPSPPPMRNSSDIPDIAEPPPVRSRDVTSSTIRVVNEEEDDVPNKLATIPGSRGSEHLGHPSKAGDNTQSVVTRRGSRTSFFRDSIPAWARTYYARPQSSASFSKPGRNERPSTSTDNISLNIFRPRTRNRRDVDGTSRPDSSATGPVRPPELDLAEIRGPPRRRVSPSWSPHLWHDRTSLGRRRTIFKAPSIDEEAEGKTPSRRNIQIWLFAIGFLLPFGWFIASVLPLPPRPEIINVKGKENANRSQLTEDLEKQLGPIDEARYENARWWRKINRIMSLVGVVIVVAVVSILNIISKTRILLTSLRSLSLWSLPNKQFSYNFFGERSYLFTISNEDDTYAI